MSSKAFRAISILTLTAASAFAIYTPVSEAVNFGNMMNPSRWFGGGDRYNDRYDEPYWDGPYGGPWGGPSGGYGYPGAYGAPYGGGMPYGMPGFGAPPGAYGGGPAYGGAPGGYGGPSGAPSGNQPQGQASSGGSEVEALKRRVEELEAQQQSQQRPSSNDWPSTPGFRPMNQY